MQGRSLLTDHHLQGLQGLSQSARDGLLAFQPKTVLDALRVPGVGRKPTARLLALGLLRDRGRQATLISEHPNLDDAFEAIDALAARMDRTGAPTNAVELVVVDAEGNVVPRPRAT